MISDKRVKIRHPELDSGSIRLINIICAKIEIRRFI